MAAPLGDHDARLQPCTACGAAPGEPCVSLGDLMDGNGRNPQPVIHDARKKTLGGKPFPWLLPPASYAGIGSRETPPEVQCHMHLIASGLADRGWVLRTGVAEGADEAFWLGAHRATRPPLSPEAYLPWPGFRGYSDQGCRLTRPTPEAYEIARQHHPRWDGLGDAARKLLARNTHQVLGADCKSPSAYVVCWTKDGATDRTTSRTGGTGQAIRVAVAHGIPVYNLRLEAHERLWLRALGEMRLLEQFAKMKREARR